MSPTKATRASRSQSAATYASTRTTTTKVDVDGTVMKARRAVFPKTASVRSSSVLSSDPASASDSDFETQPEAGPSTPSQRQAGPSSAAPTTAAGTADGDAKGKGKAPERRVLPARIRRSAGGGEGMRDVEEMIVDWLERWGEPSATPPDDLPIHLTSLPLAFVQPAPYLFMSRSSQPDAPAITLTPTRNQSEMVDPEGRIGKEDKIEVPSWVMVRAGEDDKEEAREELESGLGGRSKGAVSPVKRLRRGGIGDEPEEDTSDAYYAQLHKKYEVFERRQRIREKEKLQFEKYKMKSRIDLLRNLPKLTWTTIVSTIIGRGPEEWDKGKEMVRLKGPDWLQRKLIKEGEEVLRRYDELLPPEQRRPKTQTPQHPDSRHSTPSRASPSPSPSPSLTPPPAILPARVAALRDPSVALAKRKRRTTGSAAVVDTKDAVGDSPPKARAGDERRSSPRVLRTYGKRKRGGTASPEPEPIEVDEDGKVVGHGATVPKSDPVILRKPTIQTQPNSSGTTIQPSHSMPNLSAIQPAKPDRPLYPIFTQAIRPDPTMPPAIARPVPAILPKTANPTPTLPIKAKPAAAPTTSTLTSHHDKGPQDSVLPTPATRVPLLIAAAARREMVNGAQGGGLTKQSVGPFPFGMPVPSVVVRQSEFTISDSPDFLPLIDEREGRARRGHPANQVNALQSDHQPIDLRPANTSVKSVSRQPGLEQLSNPTKRSMMGHVVNLAEEQVSMTPEEIAELEGVEEAVVI